MRFFCARYREELAERDEVILRALEKLVVVPDETLAEGLTEVRRGAPSWRSVLPVLEAVVAFAVGDLSVELFQSGGAVTRVRAGEGTRWAGDRAVSTGTAG